MLHIQNMLQDIVSGMCTCMYFIGQCYVVLGDVGLCCCSSCASLNVFYEKPLSPVQQRPCYANAVVALEGKGRLWFSFPLLLPKRIQPMKSFTFRLEIKKIPKKIKKGTHQLTKMFHGILQHSRCSFWLLQFIVDAARNDKNKAELLGQSEHKTWGKLHFGRSLIQHDSDC